MRPQKGGGSSVRGQALDAQEEGFCHEKEGCFPKEDALDAQEEGICHKEEGICHKEEGCFPEEDAPDAQKEGVCYVGPVVDELIVFKNEKDA
jgi:hypothetical protein